MGGDDKSKEVGKPRSTPLSEDEKKAEAKKALKREVHDLLTQEAKWSQQETAYDHLPPHEKPFPIEPFRYERQRLPFKMSAEDRARREAWLKSQELTDREPVRVPELETMIYNPIRRLYRIPTDKLFNALAPIVGEHRVPGFRWLVPKFFLAWVGGCVVWYNLKFNRQNWEERTGLAPTVVASYPALLPEEKKPPIPNKWDYADRGFQSRTTHRGSNYSY